MTRKKIYLIITSLAIVTISAITFAVINKGEVVAKIGDKPIYKSDIQARLYELKDAGLIDDPDGQRSNFDHMDEERKNRIIRGFIMSDLIEKEAIDAGVEKEADYKKSLEFTVHQLRQKVYLDKIAKNNVTEDKVKKSYEQFVQNQPSREEFKIQQILAENKDEIDNIDKQAQTGGTNFLELVKKYDKYYNTEEKRDEEYLVSDQMPKELSEAISKLATGQISRPFKSDFGWHIVKLIDKRKAATPSYDELKEELREKLSQEFVSGYIEELLKKNKVKIIPEAVVE